MLFIFYIIGFTIHCPSYNIYFATEVYKSVDNFLHYFIITKIYPYCNKKFIHPCKPLTDKHLDRMNIHRNPDILLWHETC